MAWPGRMAGLKSRVEFRMLRITQQDSARGAKSYYSQSDYLSEGQELVGHWGGKGARLLGLEGVVDKPSFDRLCDNEHPKTGRQLTPINRTGRTVGYDFTFSVPKSVSLLYAMIQDQEVLEAFRSSIDETMQQIESEMKTRVRRGRQDSERLTGNMVWAEFVHMTSRPVDGIPDPQLHAHCFAMNATWDKEESRWKAGQFRDIKRDAPFFQAAFRVRLANKLQDRGFEISRKRDDFELAGASAETLAKFSRRTQEIEEVAREQGITDPDRKGELGAKTRERKTHELSWNQLRKEWYRRLTDSERHGLAKVHARQTRAVRHIGGERPAVDYAVDHCFTRESAVSERKLLTAAMQRGLGAVTVEGVERELSRRSLIRGQKDGRTFASTDFVLAEEKRLVDFAIAGRGRCKPLAPGRVCKRDWLNEGQKAVIGHVLASRDRVSIVRGPAGSGKTTLEQELGEAVGETGRPIVALAAWSRAVEVLKEQAGFKEAATVAGFLRNERMQESVRGGVILVDEAGQLGTQDMLGIFNIAEEVGARVVLLGDRKQHRSVARGEPLKLLEEKAGLPVAEVMQIIRQEREDYRRAVAALSDGKVGDGFAELDKLGWIKQVPESERYKQLAAAYLKAVNGKGKKKNEKEKPQGERKGKRRRKEKGKAASALVVSPTHAEAARITGSIRAALKAEGKLAGERLVNVWVPANLTDAEKADPTNYNAGELIEFHQNAPGHSKGSRLVVKEGEELPLAYAGRYQLYRPARLAVAEGDRIRITAGGKTKDGKHKLATGRLMTVQGFTPAGDLVVDHGWVVSGGHVALGYCVTSHASQGSSVDYVFIGQSRQSFGASNQRQILVSVSRGKKQAFIFTDSKEELLRAVERPDEPLSAMDLAETAPPKATLKSRLKKHLAFLRRTWHDRQAPARDVTMHREKDHVR